MKLTEGSREVREIKKILPFTINAIGDKAALEQWKAAKAVKDMAFEARLEKHVKDVKIKLAANYIFDASALGDSEATKRYYSLLTVKPESFIPVPGHVYTYYKRPSIFQKAVTKCLEWFLEFNF